MRELVEAVVAELKQWRRHGEEQVFIAESTLSALRALAETGVTGAIPVEKVQKSPSVKVPGEEPVPLKALERPPVPTLDFAAMTQSAAAPESTGGGKGRARPGAASAGASSRSGAAVTAESQGLPPGCEPIPAPPKFEVPPGGKAEQWAWLRAKVQDCPVCRAHLRPGGQVVFGVGSLDADLFLCGEAPGEQEERAGEPFVGPAGDFLMKVLQAMKLRREDVYLGNILNWRPEHDEPTGNRKPVPAEMAFGLPYLAAQVAIVRPKVIVALGLTAAQALLGLPARASLKSLRGPWHDFRGTPVRVTYHPSYILRQDALGADQSRAAKRDLWEDFLAVMNRVGMPISEKQRGFFTTPTAN